MSTHADLNALGMHSDKHVALSHVSAPIGKAATSLASDFVARSDALPAGTTSHAILHMAMKEFGSRKAGIVFQTQIRSSLTVRAVS